MPSNDSIGTSGLPTLARTAERAPKGFPQHDQAEIAALVAAAQRGEPEAFGQLYTIYCDEVFRFVYSRVGLHALAEDLTSETFFRALKNIGTFRFRGDGAEFGGWLIVIARNLIADNFKSARSRFEAPTADMMDADRSVPGPEINVLQLLRDQLLMQAVASLTGPQRRCIELRFLQELSIAETAQAMGLNIGAVKTVQWRAVQRLGRNPLLADLIDTLGG